MSKLEWNGINSAPLDPFCGSVDSVKKESYAKYDGKFVEPTEDFPCEHKSVPVIPTESMIRAACVSQWDDPTVNEIDRTYENWKAGQSNAISDMIRNIVTKDYMAMVAAYNPPVMVNASEVLDNVDVVLTEKEYEELVSGHNAMIRDLEDRLKPIYDYIEYNAGYADKVTITAKEALSRMKLIMSDMGMRLYE